jgi:SAM-dependent methyltransferase
MNKVAASIEGLERFSAVLPWDELEGVAMPYLNTDRTKATAFLKTLQLEAQFGLNLILSQLSHDKRILEVGAGIGLLAGYLNSCGYLIKALEPGLGGFGVSAALATAVSSRPEFSSLHRLDVPAEKLNPALHGRFDFIYSINVLEHIPDLENAVRGMGTVLENRGEMVHTCPNYFVPYEPHFGIPLVPVAPRFTVNFLPKLKDSELWQSLNFITAARLNRACRAQGLMMNLEPGVMLRTFTRFDTDSEFRRRQGISFVFRIFLFLKFTGLLYLLGKLPASWCTPMVVQITRRESNS